MSKEWMWAAVIIAIPLIALGVLEVATVVRRRRREALARRSKSVERPVSDSRRRRRSRSN